MKRYLVPPKLQSKLLLANLTIPEIGIATILLVAGFFSANRLNSISWTTTWFLFVARIFSGKSLFAILKLMIRYHFLSSQQFIRRKSNAKIKHRKFN